jgi:NADH-quinone oxidoreductase subunit E
MNGKEIDEILEKYADPTGQTLSILEDVQAKEKYLSRDTLSLVSVKTGLPVAKLYSVATFYSFFNLQPVGTNIISVCMGTACHVKGASQILEALQNLLELKGNGMTENRKFILTTKDECCTLTQARCFGACSMAPVISINEKVYGYADVRKLPKILKKYGWQEKK